MRQQQAIDILKTGVNVFLTGEPGAGKTYTIMQFIKWMNEEKIEYAITASTGIAASHLDGSTIHSWVGMGIKRDLKEGQIAGIVGNGKIWERVKPVEVLVIDEISMLDAVNINDISNILKKIHKNSRPFGGIQVVFVGDFFQLPPVSKGGIAEFAFEADAWNAAEPVICYLTEQHRQSDTEFLEILSAMRNGTVTEAHKERLLACQRKEKPETDLFTHNADVDILNNRELAKLPGKERVYVMDEGGDQYALETLKRSCLSPEKLVLKEGALVMFTRNNFNEGYVNGSIGKVEKLGTGENMTIRLLSGGVVRPERARWSIRSRRQEKAYIEQIPLRLAWAITVHKSQGMSLDTASVDLTKTFEFGQGYVAISRVRSLQGLHLKGINDMVFKMHPKVIEQDRIFRNYQHQGALE